jgi:hypothetical protein
VALALSPAMRRRADKLAANRPDRRPNSPLILHFEKRRRRSPVVVTDGGVWNTGDLPVRTRNSGENEADFFAAKLAKKTICRKMNLPTKMCHADGRATKL